MSFVSRPTATRRFRPFRRTALQPADLGFTNVVPDDPGGAALPIVFGPSFTIGPSSQGPTRLRRATFEWEDNFTWTLGRHEIKFGGDITRIRQNYHYDFYNNGSFDFTFGEFHRR